MVAPLIAAKAYAAAQGIAGAEHRRRRGAAATGPNFGQMVTQAINQVAATNSQTAETQMTATCRARPTWSTW